MWDQLLSSTGWWEGEIWNRKKDGSHYLEWLNVKVVRDLRGVITNYIGVFSDIKKIAVTQRRIEFLADELSQLPNRAVFCDGLRNALECCRHPLAARLRLHLSTLTTSKSSMIP